MATQDVIFGALDALLALFTDANGELTCDLEKLEKEINTNIPGASATYNLMTWSQILFNACPSYENVEKLAGRVDFVKKHLNGSPMQVLELGLFVDSPDVVDFAVYDWVESYLLKAVDNNAPKCLARAMTRASPAMLNEALCKACYYGRIECVRLLLADERVDPTENIYASIKAARTSSQFDVIDLLLADKRVDSGSYAFKLAMRMGEAASHGFDWVTII